MSGNRFLLDTNAVIFLLNGTSGLNRQLAEAEWIGISIITTLEFLCFDGLTESDRECFLRFCERIEVVDLCYRDAPLASIIVDLRQRYRLKIPDAIIAATAMMSGATLITADAHFDRVSELSKRSLPASSE